MKTDLGRCKKMLDSGFSLVTVGKNKIPNFAWKDKQTTPYSKDKFEQDYNYNGGKFKADKSEIPATEGVGIITGYNGLEVIDIDLKIFEDIEERQSFWAKYKEFIESHIEDFDEKFVIYRTVNGGYHILYRCEKVEGNQKIAIIKGYKEAVVETRGIGGYVFIYDKQISKKNYFEIEEITVAEREALFYCSRYFNYTPEVDNIIPESLKKSEPQVSIPVWEDFNSKNSVLDIVRDEFTIVKQLPDRYVIKRNGATSPHSGYVYKDSGIMYLFSTGTIYPHEKAISPFSAYTIKYYGGNFSASAKELYKEGYGTRIIPHVKGIAEKPTVQYEKIDFPLDIFPVEIQNYILQCHETLNSSIDYMGCSMLWVVSLIIGNSLKIQIKPGWVESTTVWIAVIGEAGIGKTPSISKAVFPLEKENSMEERKFARQWAKYLEYSTLDKKEKQNTEHIPKPRNSQFIVDDITLEALFDLHEENKNGIGVFKDELKAWLNDMNKYRKGSDMQAWLSSWSNKPISLNRKTSKSSFVPQPLIPVLGGIQPGIFESFYTDENKDNGFLDRMLLCYPDLIVDEYNDNELSWNMINWYSNYIAAFFREIRDGYVIYNKDDEVDARVATFTPEAKIEWKRIFNKITGQQNSDEENEYMKSMLPKQKSYIPRFALILNTLEIFNRSGSTKEFIHITKESILKAERLSNYFINMAKKIKATTADLTQMKGILELAKTKSPYEKFLIVYRSNPDFNKKDLAEKLGVSRTTIYEFIKKAEETPKMKVAQ